MVSPNISVQLYTVREALAEDLPGTLAKLAEAGYTTVEPYNFAGFDELGAGLAAAGLQAPTTHQHFIGEPEADQDAIFAKAAELGIGTVIDPHVPTERWQEAADIEATAAALNESATIAARHGITVGYHNHAHEITPQIEGVSALEYFAGKLDDAVKLEIDTYWVVVGGGDPLALIEKLGSRVVALHIKDGDGSADTKKQVAVGSGTLPIADIIAAAPDALHVVELDDSEGDRFTAVIDSLAFLKGLA